MNQSRGCHSTELEPAKWQVKVHGPLELAAISNPVTHTTAWCWWTAALIATIKKCRALFLITSGLKLYAGAPQPGSVNDSSLFRRTAVQMFQKLFSAGMFGVRSFNSQILQQRIRVYHQFLSNHTALRRYKMSQIWETDCCLPPGTPFRHNTCKAGTLTALADAVSVQVT